MAEVVDISIITASFNILKNGRKEKMVRCLESIRNQTGCQPEHLIIDGGSTDGTLDFLRPYEEKGWIKIYSEPDKGIYDAFNKGIGKASGQYVSFINSDDYLKDREGLSTSLKYLQQSRADFSYSPVGYEREGKITDTDEKTVNMCNVFYYMPGSHQGMVFKKNLFNKVGIHELKFVISADYDFILRAILSKATFIKVPVLYAVFGMEGLSGNNMPQITAESIEIKSKNYGITLEQAQAIHQSLYIPWRLYFNLLGQTSIPNKFSYLLKNWKHSPQKKYLKTLRHWILTLRTRKGHRIFRVLGINLINEEQE